MPAASPLEVITTRENQLICPPASKTETAKKQHSSKSGKDITSFFYFDMNDPRFNQFESKPQRILSQSPPMLNDKDFPSIPNQGKRNLVSRLRNLSAPQPINPPIPTSPSKLPSNQPPSKQLPSRQSISARPSTKHTSSHPPSSHPPSSYLPSSHPLSSPLSGWALSRQSPSRQPPSIHPSSTKPTSSHCPCTHPLSSQPFGWAPSGQSASGQSSSRQPPQIHPTKPTSSHTPFSHTHSSQPSQKNNRNQQNYQKYQYYQKVVLYVDSNYQTTTTDLIKAIKMRHPNASSTKFDIEFRRSYTLKKTYEMVKNRDHADAIVIISVLTNDARNGKSLHYIHKLQEDIAWMLKAETSASNIIFVGCPPSTAFNTLSYNKETEKVCKQENVGFHPQNQVNKSHLATDGYHIMKGYQFLITKTIAAAILSSTHGVKLHTFV